MALVDTVEHLKTALDYHLTRHNLLASNLAHIDTPDYAPVDLSRGFEGAMHAALGRTHSEHLQSSTRTEHGFRVISSPGIGRGGDGNGVDLDHEAMKIASNQLRYDMLAQLASSELASLSWAASDGRQ